jgi:TonB family protein
MKQNSVIVILVALLICLALESPNSGFARSHGLVTPNVSRASDIPYPIDTMASGIVTLSLYLGAAGQVQNVQVLRDIPSLTSPANMAAKIWTFTPATLEGSPVPSTLSVSVVFNPGNLQSQSLNLPPVQATSPPNPPGFLPPEISAASYASYPVNSVATGSVVLDVTVDKSGQITKVTAIRGVPSLNSRAISAVKTWTINPATFNGKAITAKVIVAFVFRSPTITSP